MSMDVLEVEGDSQQAVKILNKEVKCPVGVEVLIEDTRHLGHQFARCGFRLTS